MLYVTITSIILLEFNFVNFNYFKIINISNILLQLLPAL